MSHHPRRPDTHSTHPTIPGSTHPTRSATARETAVTTTTAPDPTPADAVTSEASGPRRRRRPWAVLGVVALLAVAVPATAQVAGFRDVDGAYVHSDAIAQLRTAGVTIGCGDGSRYCPTDEVTRGAMASFIARGGSQAAANSSVTTLAAGSGNVNGVPVTVDVTGAGESGGRQNVVLQGSVTVHHDGALSGCPCEVEAFIYRARGEVQGASSWSVLSGDPASGSGVTSVSVPVTWATTIDAGRREQYRVAVFVEGTTAGGLRAEGSLTAVTAPFGRVP